MSDYGSTESLPLFDAPARNVDPPQAITRPSHPKTSEEAAASLIGSGRRAKDAEDALELVRRFPGLTGYELAAKDSTGDGERIRKRLGGLKNANRIKHGEKRKCEIKKSNCVTWWPAVGGGSNG